MIPLRHQRIIANAGSGKTYKLTSRYLDLLDRGEAPERIIALTFTRKAAGEFLEKIFARLLEDCSDAGLARLRLMIEKLPQLALGTLDGFFGRMVRAFPFECGLAGEISILDEHALAVARRRTLDVVFRGHAEDGEAFDEFLDLIRKQNRNSEGRDVTQTLASEIEALQERYLLTPPGAPWGDAAAIWPSGSPFLDAPPLAALVEDFSRVLPDCDDETFRARWESLVEDLRALRPGSPAGEAALKFALQAIDPPADKGGGFYLKIHGNKRFAFSPECRGLVVSLGRAILRVELESHLTRSRALYDLVARFERPYQEMVREAGCLTFTDITGLLASAGGAVWGGQTLRPFSRQEMDFRLDATYDHWMLDEFQDTSRLQWLAVRNLVDEVVQSDTGRRSFFYVGDTKQAIYTWRGGDPRLFDEISDHYNASGTDRIDTSEALAVSRRSVPEILEAVNALFAPAHLDHLAEDLALPAETLERWTSAWRDHQPHKQEPGCVFWKQFPDAGPELLDTETARLIAEVSPLSRGLSCAVLVRTNSRVNSVIEALRAAGIEARSEGRYCPCTDNDLGAALLALFRAVAHPDDTMAGEHVRMTPLRPILEEENFPLSALRLIQCEGFAGAVAVWLEGLPANAFSRQRGSEFLQACADFDALRGAAGTIDEFVQFAQTFTTAEDAADGVVRVLTIHASKGLDFDMVVLPDLEGLALASRRREAPVHLQADARGRVLWGMELPPQKICDADPVLRAAAADVLAADCYEHLCLYYVALTRAKHGLYLLSSKQKSDSKRRDFNRVLHATFTAEEGIHLSGNPDWPALVSPEPKPAPTLQLQALPAEPRTEIHPDFPSRRLALQPFGKGAALALGTEAHAFLARISWNGEPQPELDDVSAEARDLLQKFLGKPAARDIFTRPAGVTGLWREQAFDVLLDGRWISGVFDRVVLRGDRAEIFDFKTSGENLAAAYGEQMNLYRRGLAELCGLPAENISATVVNLQTGQKIAVD
jgi:ATP-dependent helicase/nuclease subunit A